MSETACISYFISNLLTTLLFNNIPGSDEYLLCFHTHSSFPHRFSTAVLCFQQHSCVVRSKKFFLSLLATFGHPEAWCSLRHPT